MEIEKRFFDIREIYFKQNVLLHLQPALYANGHDEDGVEK
jgi:hypothetical protein